MGEPEGSRRGWGQGRGVEERNSLQRGSGSFSLLALSAMTQEKKHFETVSDVAKSYTKHASQTLAAGEEPGGRLGMKHSLGGGVHFIGSAEI